MKILTNIDRQKTNNVNEEDTRNKRYNDTHQRVNISKNDIIFITRWTSNGEKIIFKNADTILPPSKPSIGSILRTPRHIDDITKRESEENEKNSIKIIADTKFNRGPPRHIIISSLYEYVILAGYSAAPNIPRRNSLRSIPLSLAIIR